MSTFNKKTALAAMALVPAALQSASAASKIPKISGGMPVPSDVNYVVELNPNDFSMCTGILIAPEYLLATAVCFLDVYGDSEYDVSSMSIRNQMTGQVVTPDSFDLFVPPEYGPENQLLYKEYFAGNLAVAHIPSLAQFDNVTYPRLGGFDDAIDALQSGNSPEFFVIGAGEDSFLGTLETRYAPFQILAGLGVSPPGDSIEIESDHFTVQSNESGTCFGDQSAPLVVPGSLWTGDTPTQEASQDLIIGMSSWTTGSGCADDDVMAFIDIAAHAQFIEDALSGEIQPLEPYLPGWVDPVPDFYDFYDVINL